LKAAAAPGRAGPGLAPAAGAGLILAAVAAAYSPALRGGMLWDDDAHLTRPGLQSLAGLGRIWFKLGATQQYYPVLHTAFWLEHRLWGEATLGYHLVNLLLHAAVACLFALVLGRLAPAGGWPWLAGLVFALHPVCVESVAWISEQKNTLSGVFYLLAAWHYLRWREGTGPSGRGGSALRYLLATGCFLLALLSKSVTATLPAALLVVQWWRQGALSGRKDVVPLLPWLGLGAAAGLFTAWVERTYIGAQGAAFALGPGERCLLAGRVIWFYLGKLCWPAPLIFVYPRWTVSGAVAWQYGFPLAALALGAALWAARGRSRAPLAAFLFFAGTLFPALGFLNVYPFVFSYVADHFQYLASLGVIALVARGGGASLAARWPRFARVAAGVVLAALATLTWRQCRVYRDAPTLYRATIARNPGAWLAHNNLGVALFAEGRVGEAMAEYRETARLQPGYADAYLNLGLALAAAGRGDDAIAAYRTALRLKPDLAKAEDALGLACAHQGRMTEAIAHYRSALRLSPDDPETYNNLGIAAQATADPGEAIQDFAAALRLRPGYAEAHSNLGSVLAQLGRTDEAISHYQTAVRLEPRLASAWINLGIAFVAADRLADAIAAYQAALDLGPDGADLRVNLGNALGRAGRLPEAAQQFQAAVRLNPGDAAAHYNLGLVLQQLDRPEEAADQLAAARRLGGGAP
jgi:tetratricopeptide (TPR) repeat protein